MCWPVCLYHRIINVYANIHLYLCMQMHKTRFHQIMHNRLFTETSAVSIREYFTDIFYPVIALSLTLITPILGN